jgi:hypothetical protein
MVPEDIGAVAPKGLTQAVVAFKVLVPGVELPLAPYQTPTWNHRARPSGRRPLVNGRIGARRVIPVASAERRLPVQ